MLLKHELLPLSDFCAEGAEGCHGVDMDKFINFPDCRFGSAVCPLAPVGGKEILVRHGVNHLINSLISVSVRNILVNALSLSYHGLFRSST